jgi:hypothetical protein
MAVSRDVVFLPWKVVTVVVVVVVVYMVVVVVFMVVVAFMVVVVVVFVMGSVVVVFVVGSVVVVAGDILVSMKVGEWVTATSPTQAVLNAATDWSMLVEFTLPLDV